MASTAALTYLYDLKTTISSSLTVDQIVSTMIFGSSGIAGVYDGSHEYNAGDLVTYVDDAGVIHVYECVNDGASGEPIDLNDWKDYSILASVSNTADNLILLSSIRPSEEGNKVWLQYRGGGGGIPEGNYGLIVKNNFIISREPPEDFTTDLVWGRVTSG